MYLTLTHTCIHLYIYIYTYIYIYKHDLALNNPQELIWRKTQTDQPTVILYLLFMSILNTTF